MERGYGKPEIQGGGTPSGGKCRGWQILFPIRMDKTDKCSRFVLWQLTNA
jgi:hypothetical protein